MAVYVLIWTTKMNSLCVVSLLEAGVMRNSEDVEEVRGTNPPTLSSAILVESSWEITKLLGSFRCS